MVYTQERTNTKKKIRQQKQTLTACHTTTACRAEDKVRVAAAAWRGGTCAMSLRDKHARDVQNQVLFWKPQLLTSACRITIRKRYYLVKTSNNALGGRFCCGAAIGLLLSNYMASYPATLIAKKMSNHRVWDTEPSAAPGLWGISKNK